MAGSRATALALLALLGGSAQAGTSLRPDLVETTVDVMQQGSTLHVTDAVRNRAAFDERLLPRARTARRPPRGCVAAGLELTGVDEADGAALGRAGLVPAACLRRRPEPRSRGRRAEQLPPVPPHREGVRSNAAAVRRPHAGDDLHPRPRRRTGALEPLLAQVGP